MTVLPGMKPLDEIDTMKYEPGPGKPPNGKAMVEPCERSDGAVADATTTFWTPVLGVDGANNEDRAPGFEGEGTVNVPSVSCPVTAMLTLDPGVKPDPCVETDGVPVGSVGGCSCICTAPFVPDCGPPASTGKFFVSGKISTETVTGNALKLADAGFTVATYAPTVLGARFEHSVGLTMEQYFTSSGVVLGVMVGATG